MSEKRISISIQNFSNAVKSLEEFLALPIENDRDRAGIIQAFEYTYELAWKTIKKIAEERGLHAPTPVDAFKAGFQMDLIAENESDQWLKMKKSRNLTSHTYKRELAIEVLEDIQSTYITLFSNLHDRLPKLPNKS